MKTLTIFLVVLALAIFSGCASQMHWGDGSSGASTKDILTITNIGLSLAKTREDSLKVIEKMLKTVPKENDIYKIGTMKNWTGSTKAVLVVRRNGTMETYNPDGTQITYRQDGKELWFHGSSRFPAGWYSRGLGGFYWPRGSYSPGQIYHR